MFDSLKFLENSKKQKAVDNPRIRRDDPACWTCLSDEQRDIVNEWYLQLLIEKEQKIQAEAAQNSRAAIIGLSPFAFFYAMTHDSSFWYFLLEAAAALFVWSLIFHLFSNAYLFAKKARPSMGKVDSILFNAAALGISLFAVSCLLSHVI